MKRLVVLAMLAIELLSPVLASAYLMQQDEEVLKGFALSRMVEDSEIVVVGTVEHMVYQNLPMITTDVIIRIENLVKGEPNMGVDHVVFMIEGGVGYGAHDGELVRLHVSSEPEFELNERVMVFLRRNIK